MEAKETVKVIFWDVWEMAGVHDHQPSQPLGQWGCSPSCSPCSYVTIPPQPDSCLYSCCWNVWQLSYLPTVVSSSQSSSSPFHQSSTSSPLVLWSRSWFRMLRDSFLHYVPPLYPTIPILHQIQISSPIQASSSSAFIRWWDDPSSSRDYLHWPIAVSCVVRVWEVKREFLHLHICMFRQTMITGHSRGDSEDIPDRDWTHDGRMKFSNYGWYRCIGAGQKDSDKSWYFINIFNALFVIVYILIMYLFIVSIQSVNNS